MNTSLTPSAPLPLFPPWAVRRATQFRCATGGCHCHFLGHELTPGQRWIGDEHWFAPCGHSVTALRPYARALEVKA